MPSRFNISNDSNMHRLLSQLNVDLGPIPNRYNLAPTDQIPVIHHWEGLRLISDMRWWLVPHWSDGPSTHYPMFNARYETLENSRAYQGCFRHKRCIIPAHSFVEWQHSEQQKTPYLFSAVDQAIAFAGLWDYWTNGIEHVLSCAMITTQASPEFEPYHQRMPVMLNATNAELWLDEKQDTKTLYPLFESTLPYCLQAVEIDSEYSNVRNKAKPVLVGNVVNLGLKE
ncbi:MAG: SOS response-associated peptidase [Methylococcales bacterium]